MNQQITPNLPYVNETALATILRSLINQDILSTSYCQRPPTTTTTFLPQVTTSKDLPFYYFNPINDFKDEIARYLITFNQAEDMKVALELAKDCTLSSN